MEESKFTKEGIIEDFNSHDTLTVVFRKKDESERVMTCTRNLAHIPEKDRPSGESKRKEPEFTLPVYEIGVGWRSFDVRRVIVVDPAV